MTAAHTQLIDGVQRAQFDLGRALAARGHAIDLVAERGGDNLDAWRSFARTIRVGEPLALTPHTPARALRHAARVAARRTAPDVDVVYCHRVDQLNWSAAVAGLRRVPLVFHAHNAPPPWFAYGRANVPGARRVATTITASRFIAAQWEERGARPGSVVSVPYGIDTELFSPAADGAERAARRRELGVPEDAELVVFVGRLEEIKGVHVLLEAFAPVAARRPRAHLLVAGAAGVSVDPAAGRDYERRLRALAPPGRVTWAGARADVTPVFRAADVVAVPSVWEEPSGLVVAEAMACGVPPVGSATGGMREQYDEPWLDELLVPPGDAEALAERVEALLAWREERPDLGGRLRAHVVERRALGAIAPLVEEHLLPSSRA